MIQRIINSQYNFLNMMITSQRVIWSHVHDAWLLCSDPGLECWDSLRALQRALLTEKRCQASSLHKCFLLTCFTVKQNTTTRTKRTPAYIWSTTRTTAQRSKDSNFAVSSVELSRVYIVTLNNANAASRHGWESDFLTNLQHCVQRVKF